MYPHSGILIILLSIHKTSLLIFSKLVDNKLDVDASSTSDCGNATSLVQIQDCYCRYVTCNDFTVNTLNSLNQSAHSGRFVWGEFMKKSLSYDEPHYKVRFCVYTASARAHIEVFWFSCSVIYISA